MCLSIPQNYREIFSYISSFLKYGRDNYLPMLVLAFILNVGKLSLRNLGQAIVTEQRHKSNVDRVFNNPDFYTQQVYRQFFGLFFQQQTFLSRWLVICDTTTKKTTRKWQRRKRNRGKGGKRRLKCRHGNSIKYKNKGKQGTGSQTHLWVMGLLITDKGMRIPLPRKSYYTKDYAKKHGLKYHSQVDLVVNMLNSLPVPEHVEVVVVVDNFFESKKLDRVCHKYQFTYVTAVDSHRCLADEKGNSNGHHVVSLLEELPSDAFQKITLAENSEQYHCFRRRPGRRKARVYYVCKKTLDIAKLGMRTVVFSKKQKIEGKQRSFTTKVLLTNNDHLTVEQIVELYELRWEIELYFKELKSYLHFNDYSFEDFKAAERWVDMVLIAFLLLEYRRWQLIQSAALPKTKNQFNLARTPQMMEIIKTEVNEQNVLYIKETLKSAYGRQHLLNALAKINLVA
jgi:IS4 transposase